MSYQSKKKEILALVLFLVCFLIFGILGATQTVFGLLYIAILGTALTGTLLFSHFLEWLEKRTFEKDLKQMLSNEEL